MNEWHIWRVQHNSSECQLFMHVNSHRKTITVVLSYLNRFPLLLADSRFPKTCRLQKDSMTASHGMKRLASTRSISPPAVKRKVEPSVTSKCVMWLLRKGRTGQLFLVYLFIHSFPPEKSVAAFFTPTSKKKQEPEQISWHIVGGSLVVGKYATAEVVNDNDNAAGENESKNGNGSGKRKVAVFDLVCWFGPWDIIICVLQAYSKN